MIRALRYGLMALVALGLVTFALANRAPVVLALLPPDLAQLLAIDLSVQVPLWAVFFAGLLGGLILGFIWEWLREHRYRAQAKSGQRQVQQLERELAVMKDSTGLPEDDILALIDKPKAR